MTHTRNREKDGIQVRARDNEAPERMIKRFMKKVRESGILQELRMKSWHEKPGQKRRRKRNAAIYAAKMLAKKEKTKKA